MVYRQTLEIEDYKTTLIWELVIGEDYNALFAGNESEVKDVDILEFDSIKFDAEDNELRQKEDEMTLTLSEMAVRTEEEIEARNLLQTSNIFDVWTALFLYEKGTDGSRKPANLVFSGLIRKDASAEDIAWGGEEWSSQNEAVRTWKFKSQSFGEAVLDTIKLASKNEDGEIVQGLLEQLNIDEITRDVMVKNAVQIPNSEMKPLVKFENKKYKKATHLNSLLKLLIEKTQEIKRQSIPDFTIETSESLTGYVYGRREIGDTNIQSYRFRLFADDDDDKTAGIHIDSRLIKPEMEADGISPQSHYKLSWHRFNSLTDLLYSLATYFGNQLSIKTIDKGKVKIEFVQLSDEYGKTVQILDASSGQVDYFQFENSSNLYAAKATVMNSEGQDINKIEGAPPEHYALRLRDLPKLPESEKLLPLSISETWQAFDIGKIVHPAMPWSFLLHQNCEGDFPSSFTGILQTYEMTWTGIIAGISGDEAAPYSVVNRVASTIGRSDKWHYRISDCINKRVSALKRDIGSTYQIEVPFINAVRSERGVGLKNIRLFDRIVLNGEKYFITGIEANPVESKLKLKLTSTNKYKIFADPTEEEKEETPGGGSSSGGESPSYEGPTGTAVHSVYENLKRGDLVRWDSEARGLKKYRNLAEHYGKFYGVAARDANVGGYTPVHKSGVFEDATLALEPGRPVYARYNSALNKCVPSTNRLMTRTATEQIDLELGTAKSATEWELKIPTKEYEIK